MDKKVLLMNDLPGYGRVALSAMMPILAQRGFSVYNLPTAVISNTLDFGKYNILDTTDYMRRSVETWKTLGFSFDAVAVGYIASKNQGEFIRDFCDGQAKDGALIWIDPIMADNGKFYNGMGDENVRMLRRMLPVSDYVVPNYTEAALLAGEVYQGDGLAGRDAEMLTDKLIDMGAKSVVITSAIVDGKSAVVGYDRITNEHFICNYVPLKGSVPGTGDIFLALLMRETLGGKTLKESAGIAVDTVREWLAGSIENGDDYHGIQVEKYF